MNVQRILILMLLVLMVQPTWAQEADSTAVVPTVALPDDVNPGSGGVDAYGLMARMALSLAVVVAVIWGALALIRRLSGRNGLSGSGRSRIRVLERSYIAPKKAVYIVQVGERSLALGVTDTQLTTLAELDPVETLAAYPSLREEGGVPPFASLLRDVRNRFRGRDSDGERA